MSKIIRASSLNSYNDCPMRTFANNYSKLIEELGYVLNPRKSGVGAVFGTACHAAFSHSLENKIQGKSKIKTSELVDLSINNFDENFSNSNDFLFDTTTPNKNKAYTQIKRTNDLFNLFVYDTITPELIEERFFLKLKNDFILSGQMDAVSDDIDDFKTGREGNFSGQFGGYALLLMANKKGVKKTANAIYIPRDEKVKLPFKIIYDSKTCVQVAKNTLENIASDYDMIEQSSSVESVRCNSMSVLCSAKYCRAWGTEACRNTSVKKEKLIYS